MQISNCWRAQASLSASVRVSGPSHRPHAHWLLNTVEGGQTNPVLLNAAAATGLYSENAAEVPVMRQADQFVLKQCATAHGALTPLGPAAVGPGDQAAMGSGIPSIRRCRGFATTPSSAARMR